MIDQIREWLAVWSAQDAAVPIWVRLIAFALVLGAAALANFIVKQVLLRTIQHIIHRSATAYDDLLMERKVFTRLCHLVPALMIYILTPLAFSGYGTAISAIQTAAKIYMLLMGMLALDAFLNAIVDIYHSTSLFQKVPIRGFVQVIKIVAFCFAIIIVISLIIGQSPFILIGGLGAMTAVLILVFKDSILGLVAGVQLSMNDMVRIGDWIQMPKYHADGDVIDIALTTVKVQNWDKTISTIPAYALISDSFRNWRGMSESGGRRIKRAVNLDMNSVAFCTPEMIERFKKIHVLREYIERKEKELAEYNATHGIDDSVLVNGRRMTNLGTFRAYVVAYLKNHPQVRQDMTFLVRHLQPTEHGLPMEIYVFSKDQRWAYYESIQADIFDHILAVVPEFGLRVFQAPSGTDLAGLGSSLTATRPSGS
jgi:miniconductance mechanosensitive channel